MSKGFRVGDKLPVESFDGKPDYIKVMAWADGYVMARRKGCLPFVLSIKEFKEYVNKKCFPKNKKP